MTSIEQHFDTFRHILILQTLIFIFIFIVLIKYTQKS
uniref:Similarity. Hypothetical start n=1 Tax=Microcystis aeruginosa (strain PCC 7806) TaxID=267872 RepID=A8YI66_MICA7|nr:unnamed protein product [Microcystis aeruginosa PCC 7806]